MGEPISVRFPQSFIDRIEEWRAEQRPIPSRGEAIRKLAEYGLEVYGREDASKAEKADSEKRRGGE